MSINPEYELAFYKQTNAYNRMRGLSPDAYGLCIRKKTKYVDDYGLPEYANLTVNLPGRTSGEPEFIGIKCSAYMDVNHWKNECEALLSEEFEGEPIARDTGFTLQSGFVTYPLYQFNEKWIKSLPVMYLAFADTEKYLAQYDWDVNDTDNEVAAG